MDYELSSRIANDYQKTERLNILLILTDQQQCDTIGAYGNRIISTPNIDSLASDGVLFQRAYTTCPLCAPARASLFSSLPISCTGLPVNDDDARMIALSDQVTTIGDVFKSENYKCGYFGKWHMGRDETSQHGFTDGWFVHLRNSYENWLERNGKYSFSDDVKSYARRGVVPFELAHDTEVTSRAIQFIERNAENNFFCVCSMRAPHDPYIGPFDDLYKPEDIPLPVNFVDDLSGKPASQRNSFARRFAQTHNIDDPAAFKKIIAGYWGLVHLIDQNVGRLLYTLKRKGLERNTIVMFAVDHGEMMGSHGLLAKGPFMYEETNRVPLIVRFPGKRHKGLRIASLVSMLDYAPTLIDYAELHAPGTMRGRSLRALIDQTEISETPIHWRDAVFTELYEIYTQRCPIWSVTTEQWKYNYYFGDTDELYDLHNDPAELRNLAPDPGYRNLLYEMRQRLADWAEINSGLSLSDLVRTAGHTVTPGIFQ
jgi:arylsulfatase A-like enzyme